MRAIIICGLPVTGKTTLAQKIADHYKIKYYNTGDLLKEVSMEYGYTPGGSGWWGTDDGIKFLKQREGDASIDKKFDEMLIEIANRGDCVLSSWTLPWLFDGGLNIWLTASDKERANRTVKRDGVEFSEALDIVRKRDLKNNELFKKIYEIDFGGDMKPFDFVIDTTEMDANEVFGDVVKKIDSSV